MPLPLKRILKVAAHPLDPLYVRMYRARTGETEPIPPLRLRSRVGVGQDPGLYLRSGAKVADALRTALRESDRPFESFDRVLDFGCGCGRVLQHVRGHGADQPRLHGCDVDDEAVGWAAGSLPEVEFHVNNERPPLPYEDDAFELVYSVSIFTHLDEQSQDAWLRELKRILAPDGVALVTTNGLGVFAAFATGMQTSMSRDLSERIARRNPLALEKFVFEPYRRSRWNEPDLPGVGASYGLTFHSREYIREHWSRFFAIQRFWPDSINDGQDLVLLQAAGEDRRSALAQTTRVGLDSRHG